MGRRPASAPTETARCGHHLLSRFDAPSCARHCRGSASLLTKPCSLCGATLLCSLQFLFYIVINYYYIPYFCGHLSKNLYWMLTSDRKEKPCMYVVSQLNKLRF